MKVLIVDDSEEMQRTLAKILASSGCEVIRAMSASDAKAQLRAAGLDLVLLDVTLPDQDGFQLFAEISAELTLRRVPVIFITGKSETASKVAAFAIGAEDYIVKPFDPLEVKARLEAKLRKIAGQRGQSASLRIGHLQIEFSQQRVFDHSGGTAEAISLTAKEFQILVFLAKNEEMIASRNQILDAVWGHDANVFDRTVDAHISTLRKKLGASSSYIQSVLGAGYRLSAAPKTRKKAA